MPAGRSTAVCAHVWAVRQALGRGLINSTDVSRPASCSLNAFSSSLNISSADSIGNNGRRFTSPFLKLTVGFNAEAISLITWLLSKQVESSTLFGKTEDPPASIILLNLCDLALKPEPIVEKAVPI